MPRYSKSSRYSVQEASEIRYNIMGALDELAIYSGIDIKTMQTTAPYSFVLNGVTSQKIAAELKKMIDIGLVVKETAKNKTVKYMLKSQYDALFEEGKVSIERFGYGDYRDNKKQEEEDEEKEEGVCARIAATAGRTRYSDMWEEE